MIAQNGIEYDVRTDGTSIEIERDNPTTGLRIVFVFQDLGIGRKESGRKEAVFYSYDITPTGERINRKTHAFTDTGEQFEAFAASELWQALKEQIINDFLLKIEGTKL